MVGIFDSNSLISYSVCANIVKYLFDCLISPASFSFFMLFNYFSILFAISLNLILRVTTFVTPNYLPKIPYYEFFSA